MALLRNLRLGRRLTAKPWLAILILLLVVLAVLELTHATHLLNKPKAVSGTIPSTNIESQSSSSSSQSGSANNSQGQAPAQAPKSEAANAGDTNATLIEPSGTFASYHRPSLSGNGAPSKESSSCHTTAGATCTIVFTQNGATKTLAAQTTDANGNTFWDWDVNQAGFTTGSWKISATVTLGSRTKTVNDTLTLDVQP